MHRRISARHKGFTRRGAHPKWIFGNISASCEEFFAVWSLHYPSSYHCALMEELSVFSIVLFSFTSTIPYLLPGISRTSLFFCKNILCLTKKANVCVNENKTSICFLCSKLRVYGWFLFLSLYDVPCCCSFVEWVKEHEASVPQCVNSWDWVYSFAPEISNSINTI